MLKALGPIGISLLLLSELVSAAFVDVYSIGNSLTVDLSATVLDALTANEQNPLRVGFHAKCGSSLTSIVANPTFCLASDKFGQFPTVLANNHFDVVTLQPFSGSSIREEIEATKTIVKQLRENPSNANTRVLVYAAWPQNSVALPFPQRWNSVGATLDSPFESTEEVYRLFMNELKISVPEAELLPVGHVFNALAPKIDQGLLPGLTTFNQLYRDEIHSSSAGRYIADLTAYALIYGKSPEGLGYPTIFSQTTGPFISDERARFVAQQVVWKTVQDLTSVPEPTNSLGYLLLFLLILVMHRTNRVSIRLQYCLTSTPM